VSRSVCSRCSTICSCSLSKRLTNEMKSNSPSCAWRCRTDRSVVPPVFSRWWKKTTEQLGSGCTTSEDGVGAVGAVGCCCTDSTAAPFGNPAAATFACPGTSDCGRLPGCTPASASPAGALIVGREARYTMSTRNSVKPISVSLFVGAIERTFTLSVPITSKCVQVRAWPKDRR